MILSYKVVLLLGCVTQHITSRYRGSCHVIFQLVNSNSFVAIDTFDRLLVYQVREHPSEIEKKIV